MDEHPEVIGTAGGPIDRTRVTLAVHGDDLDPDAVTALLGRTPTDAHRRGDRKGPRSPPYRCGGWFLVLEGTAPEDAESLTRALLEALPADHAIWTKLHAAYELQLWLGLFVKHWNRGLDLSVELLTRLATLKIPLVFDIYVEVDEDDEAVSSER
jgi:hypothetical protein